MLKLTIVSQNFTIPVPPSQTTLFKCLCHFGGYSEDTFFFSFSASIYTKSDQSKSSSAILQLVFTA